ncbi:MAG: beta-galactosidase [bacterium]
MTTTCRIAGTVFRINGKDSFLYSSEVHYFRIPKKFWAKHLQAVVDAGCNAVSTYVPWSWHEFKEGTIDLTGRTHPERDLAGFVDLAAKFNLHVTLKPGPYVMAETTDQGIPQWLVDTYPETLALDDQGNPWGSAFVSTVNPLFRKKAAAWLTTFARKIVVPRQSRKRGGILMLQLDNEIGIFQWLGARGEYSKSNIASWHRYLRDQHPDIRKLSALLDLTDAVDDTKAPLFQHAVQLPPRSVHAYVSHDDIPPPSRMCDSRSEAVLYRLWHDYHRWLYGDYVKFLNDTLRRSGVKTPFFTNVGGWVFGRAHEFVMNGTFHRETAKQVPDLLFGLDHIPEYVSPYNIHDGIVANQMAEELQRQRGPLYSAELQCGSREHGVQTYPTELGLFWRLCIIHGLTGMNFYMFSQGRNPRGRGSDGPLFYWYNAVDYKGNRQPTFQAVQELGEWLKANGDTIVQSKRPSGIAVAFYPHLYETEFIVPTLQKQTKLDAGKLSLSMDPVEFRNRSLFDGLIRILVKKSIPYSFADITTRSVANLRKFDTLVVMATDVMDAATQAKLAAYVKSGGRLVLYPMAPRFDRDFRPCTILGDALGIKVTGRSTTNRVYMDKLKDIPVATLPYIVAHGGSRILARDANDQVVGIEKKVGKGTVRYFGYFHNYTIEEHPDLWSAMIQFPQLRRNAMADNDNLIVETRFADPARSAAGAEAVTFVGNFHRMPMSAHVRVRDPRGRGEIDLGCIEVDSLVGLMLPVQVRLSPSLDLVFAHGELLSRKANRVTLRGPVGSAGVVELRSRKPIRRIMIDGKPAAFTTQRDVTRVTYTQTGATQVVVIE